MKDELNVEELDIDEFDYFELDKFKLDDEWVAQPRIYFNAAADLAKAKKLYAQLKARLEVESSELAKVIRQNPQQFELDKVTEDAIKQTIATSKKLIKIKNKMIEAEYNIGIIQAAVNALDHRKKGLEKLVELEGRNYFARPTLPSNVSDDAKERLERKARKTTSSAVEIKRKK